jgi:hypothetical protein
MDRKTLAALAVVTSSLLFGCDQRTPDKAAQTAPAPSAPASSAPAAAPTDDPSLPPAEAASRKPASGPDATPDTELTRAERNKAMPLPGQANDHSSPEFAKRGDDRTPTKSAN